MDFLTGVYQLLLKFSDSAFLKIWFFPLIALALIGFVPALVRRCSQWR